MNQGEECLSRHTTPNLLLKAVSQRHRSTTFFIHRRLLDATCRALFEVLEIRGVSQPLADSPDGLDIAELEQLVYFLNQWETLYNQPKENQDVYKRFLFHYSRTQKPTHPINSEFVPVHPLMRLAAKLSSRRMKRLPHPDSGAATVDFPKKGPTSTWGRPFFLFRSRNGRYIDNKFQ